MAVGMADGDRQGIGGIFLGDFRQVEQNAHHLLDLGFFRPAIADHGIFYLQGRIFENRQSGIDSGEQGRPAGMSELEGGKGIFGDEDLFDGNRLRRIADDDAGKASWMVFSRRARSSLLAVRMAPFSMWISRFPCISTMP